MNPNPLKQLLTALLLLAILEVSLGCSVCGQCNSCGADVLADSNIDGIDSLLQSKIQNLGYPVSISRSADNASISYNMVYSNGLSIALALNLANMQIQLINYALVSPSVLPPAATPATTTTYSSSTSSGSLPTTTTTTTTTGTSSSSSSSAGAVASASLTAAENGYYLINGFATDT